MTKLGAGVWLAILTVFSTPLASADSNLTAEQLCVARVIRTYRPIIDQPHFYDKYKHCAAACVITLECGRIEAWAASVGKELRDLFTPGDASLKDLKADAVGIKLVTRGYATSAQDCYSACHRFYPKPALFNF